MVKRSVSLFVLAAFCLFNWSCASSRRPSGMVKTVKKDIAQVDRTNTDLFISCVITKSGENIAFGKKQGAQFLPDGSAITGIAEQQLEFDKKDVKISYKGASGKIGKIETADGRVYKVSTSTEEGGKIRVTASGPITIPAADVQQVWFLKHDVVASVILTVVLTGALIAFGFVLAHEWNEAWNQAWTSCPFVYSFNGEEYVLDAEPYGMAVSEGLKRTDWVEMSNLKAVDGTYRVLLANELDETQYTDELKLAVVDHAPGLKVAPDTAGRIHAFANPIAPLKAYDQKGRDILKFVAGNDRVFWTSRLEEKTADDPEMRDELVFEFPKPAGAKTARLLANAWTTQWGSLSAGKFLRLFGSTLPERYADLDRFGPTYDLFTKWMSSEELYTMKVWVETPSGWKERALLYGGAPVVTKDKSYVLDVGDVTSDILRIKLRPPVNFWMINSLAVDYGEEAPIRVTELAAERAVDLYGRDVRAALAETDGAYLESPKPGERTELVFAAPPSMAGLERTVFVKVSGYYRVHIDARGEPQAELVGRLLAEPGFAARYSFREYLNWEASFRAQLNTLKKGSSPAPAR